MRILIDIGTPPQVHLFKNIIWYLEGEGHEVKITARDSQITLYLLNTYVFKYEKVRKVTPQIYRKILNIPKADYRIYKIARSFKPDILVSFGSLYLAHVAKLIKKPHIAFEDTEDSREQYWLYAPFTDAICTPSCFKAKINPKKHVQFNGYKELAYLHPNWFKPNPDIFNMLDISKDEKYVILRFSAFDASHDIVIKGFSLDDKRRLVKELKKYARVFISSEVKLPNNLEGYAIKIPPHKMHDALYYASLLVGDTGTMTTEAGILGTPAIINHPKSLEMGNFIELEKKYGLIFNIRVPRMAIKKAVELVQQSNIEQEWRKKSEKLLNDKIDVTAFMAWFIENYPESHKIMKENPEYQERFK